MYDFIIAGARCAGASAALFLGRKGYRVLLIDKYISPGPVLSTHIIGEIDIYERLGIQSRMDNYGIPAMTRMRVDLEGRVFESDICVTSRSLCVRRELLDSWLLEEATSLSNVDFRPKMKVVGPLVNNEKVTGIKCISNLGNEVEFEGRVVIGADGRNSTLAKALRPETTLFSSENHLSVYYAYLTGVEPLPIPAMEWYWNGEEIMLCSPLDGEKHCVAIMMPPHNFNSWGHELPIQFMNNLKKIRTFAPRLKNVSIELVRGVKELSSYVRKPYGSGWVLVGDAGAHLHPVSGIGIDNAVCTAEMLAEELDRYAKGEKTWEEAMKAFEMKRNERIIPQYHACLGTLSRTNVLVDQDQWEALDMLCTFPGLVKKMGGNATKILDQLREEN